MKHNPTKSLFALALALISTITAHATSVTYSYYSQMAPTDFNIATPIQQFNPAWGKLTNVVVWFKWTNHRKAIFASATGTKNNNYEVSYTCTSSLYWPNGTVLASEMHTEWAAGTLNPWGGYSAELTNNGNIYKTACVDFAPAMAQWVGTGTIAFRAGMVAVIDVGLMDFTTGEIVPLLLTEGQVEVHVTYGYTPGLTGTQWPCH